MPCPIFLFNHAMNSQEESAQHSTPDPPPGNVLPSSGATLPDWDFESPFRTAKLQCCSSYFDHAFQVATDLEKEGKTQEASLLRTLGILLSFAANYENGVEPYRPIGQNFEGRRSFIPDDLTPDDLIIVRALYLRSKDVVLRARLGDILWIREKDHKIAFAIVQDYIDAANVLLGQFKWYEACPLFRRALQLGSALGRRNTGWQTAAESFLSALNHPASSTVAVSLKAFLFVAFDMQVGESATLAQIANGYAQKANHDNCPNIERDYLLLEAEFWHRCKDSDKERTARLAAAMTYIAEAECQLKGSRPSYMAASGFLVQAIDALRQVNADSVLIARLRQTLKQYQQNTLKELDHIQTPEVDITEPIKIAENIVKAENLTDSLQLLAFGCDIIDVRKFRDEVLKRAENSPLSVFIDSGLIDGKGRVEGKMESLFLKTGAEFEKGLEARMFFQAAKADWPWRAATFIEPARLKIWQDHRPSLRDLASIVFHNPFIPPGHEQIFLMGLFYGLAGDLILSSHLLTPQIENSLRFVLEQQGADVSNIMSDLTEPVKLLGSLFDLPEMVTIFGADMCFELRGHLIEKSGFAFRNQVAHGFVGDMDCYSETALNVWWLTLRLCFHCLFFLPQPPDSPSSNLPT